MSGPERCPLCGTGTPGNVQLSAHLRYRCPVTTIVRKLPELSLEDAKRLHQTAEELKP